MLVKVTLTGATLEELYNPPTLREMCLYKCLSNKDILIKEILVEEAASGSENLDWEKYRLKEPIQQDLVEALLDAREEYLFRLTPKYEPLYAALRMSQPDHLIKVNVSNTDSLEDHQLEFLLSGGNVRSLDINGCLSLGRGSLDAINKYGNKLEYLRIGDSTNIFPSPYQYYDESGILKTPKLKVFVAAQLFSNLWITGQFWKHLTKVFISNLENLQLSRIEEFDRLDFLKPASNKLTSLSLANCIVAKNEAAWSTLFKMTKIKCLDLIGTSIGEALEGQNVLERIFSAMPDLTNLTVDQDLVKNMNVSRSTRCQGSVSRRLEILGILDNDEDVLRKAKLLANKVAYFGSTEGELQIMEFYSRRLASEFSDPMLERLIKSLFVPLPSLQTAPIFALLLKTIKKNGVDIIWECLLFTIFQKQLTLDTAVKMDDALFCQCVEVMMTFIDKCAKSRTKTLPREVKFPIMVLFDLETILNFDQSVSLAESLLLIAVKAVNNSDTVVYATDDFLAFFKSPAWFLEKVLHRFTGEKKALWGMSHLVAIIGEFNGLMTLLIKEEVIVDIVEIFSSLIESLWKLCLSSEYRREAFYSAGGVQTVLEMLIEIIDGRFSLTYRASITLLEILQCIVQDAELGLIDHGIFTPVLEKLLISVHYMCHGWLSFGSEIQSHYCSVLEGIACLLIYLESDPRFDYNAAADVKKIMMELQ